MDIYTFDKIAGTPAWYYKRFPGFYNVECYNILAQWQGGVRTDNQIGKDLESQDSMQCEENKKRPRESEEQGVLETKENF